MKKYLLLIVSCYSFTMTLSAFTYAGELNRENISLSNEATSLYKIVDKEEFSDKYSNLNWMHIARLENVNSDFDLHSINEHTNWSLIVFNHNESKSFAYRLYDGRFLIILVK